MLPTDALRLTDLLTYIDPGSGSFLIQAAIAGVLGALFTVKTFWSSIKGRTRKLFGKDKADGQQSEQ